MYKEDVCRNLSIDIKMNKNQAMLGRLSFSGMVSGYWKSRVKLVDKSIKNLCLYFLLSSVITMATVCFYPFYMCHKLIKFYSYKKQYRRNHSLLEGQRFKRILVEEKTLYNLWDKYGLTEESYSIEEKLNLLQSWIDVLYPPAVSSQYNLLQMYKEYNQSITALYESLRGVTEDLDICMTFRCAFDVIFSQVSDQLPMYQDERAA